MSATESFVEIDGCRVLLRRAGAGAPLLFLHGAGGVPRWLPFYDRLSQQFEVLLPDHPSYGRSGTPDWLEEVADLAYYYLDLLAALQLQDVHVVGHSLGGWIALEMAVRSTERIRSLSLIAPVGIRLKGEPVANIFFMDRTQLMRSLYADPALAEQELAVAPTPEQVAEIAANTTATARLAWQPRFFNPKLRKWLHRIAVPTQLLWGSEDRIVPPSYAAALQVAIPGAAVTVIPRAGHLPHVERLDETAAALLGFIARNR